MDYGGSEEVDLTDFGRVFDKDSGEDELHHLYYHFGDNYEFEGSLEHLEAELMGDSFSVFCINIIKQVWPNIWISLVACLLWRTSRGFFRFLLSGRTTNILRKSPFLDILSNHLINCAVRELMGLFMLGV